MTTKIDLINGAYSQLRISGITVTPSPEDIELALKRLENMAAEFEDRNIKTGYNFEQNPDTTSLHNLPRKYWYSFEVCLAARLLPDFGKEMSPVLAMLHQSSYSFLSADTAYVRPALPPAHMPIGSGNTIKTYRYTRFHKPAAQAPIESATNIMYIGDIQNFVEDFSAYLNLAETIASFVITADTGLTITTSANATPRITYTIQAVGNSDGSASDSLQVKIVATTSDGRVETRIINFRLLVSDVID